MAIGLNPKHSTDLELEGLNKYQFLALAIEAVKKLNWRLEYKSLHGLIAYTDNGILHWNAEIKIWLEDKTAKVQSSSVGQEVFDLGKNKQVVLKFIQTLQELKGQISTEELEIKYAEFNGELSVDRDENLQLLTQSDKPFWKEALSVFLPVRDYMITPLLLDLNIVLFVLMVLTGIHWLMPDNEGLLAWGANFRPVTLDGEWWRLITSCFIHIGVFHLLMNMYALLYIGIMLEPLLGSLRFGSAYIMAGIGASLTSLWWHDFTISAGASGAIFGMYGVFLALLTTNLIESAYRKAQLSSMIVFVAYNLLYGMKGGIDNAAHLGGLVSGLLIGYAMVPGLKSIDNGKLKYGTIGVLIIVLTAFSIFIIKKLPNDIGIYDSKMKEFVSMESMALEIYNWPPDTPKERLLEELQDRGIYYWKENIKLLEGFEELDLPEEVVERNKSLREYCEIRIRSYELIYKAIEEDSDVYKDQIDRCYKQIDSLINQMGGGESK